MDQIVLSPNHIRSISASLYIVEKLIIEIEASLLISGKGTMSVTEQDIREGDKQGILAALPEIQNYIATLQHKYKLKVESSSQHAFIRSRLSKIWVVLADSTTRKMKGYGVFPPEYAVEYDQDIATLQSLVDRIESIFRESK